jgi:methylmalonyl-CoA mutase
VTRKAPAARGFGVRIDSLDDLDRALSGVMLDLIHLRLDAGGHGRQMAALVLALAERRGHGLSGLSLDLGLDPVGAWPRSAGCRPPGMRWPTAWATPSTS